MAGPGISCGPGSVAKKHIDLLSLPFSVLHNEFPSRLFMLSCSDCMNNPLGVWEDSWLDPTNSSFCIWQGTFRLGSTALVCSEQGMSKAFLFLRGTPWVWCSAWPWFAVHGGFFQGLNKWAVLSLSTEVSVGEMTPKACLCAQAGLGKALLHGFSTGILPALGKSLSVPSSCALVPGSNTSKRQLCSAACPHPLPYWCGSFLNHNCSVKHHNRRKTIPYLAS